MTSLIVLLLAQVTTPETPPDTKGLHVSLAISSSNLRSLDPLFAKVTLKNDGDQPIQFSRDVTMQSGHIKFEIYSADGKSIARAFPKGAGAGYAASAPWALKPSSSFACHGVFLFDRNSFLREPGLYTLKASVVVPDGTLIDSPPTDLAIQSRPKNEEAAIRRNQAPLYSTIDGRFSPSQIPVEIIDIHKSFEPCALKSALLLLQLVASLDAEKTDRLAVEAQIWEYRRDADEVMADMICIWVADRYFRQEQWKDAERVLTRLGEPSSVRNSLLSEIRYRLRSKEAEQ